MACKDAWAGLTFCFLLAAPEQNLELSEIEEVVKVIETEKEAEAERRRGRLAAQAQTAEEMTGGSA